MTSRRRRRRKPASVTEIVAWRICAWSFLICAVLLAISACV